jgi:hypothetical protein
VANKPNEFNQRIAEARQRQAATQAAAEREMGPQPPADATVRPGPGDSGRPQIAQEAHTSLVPRSHAERNQ